MHRFRIPLVAMALLMACGNAQAAPHLSNHAFSFVFPDSWKAYVQSPGFIVGNTVRESPIKAAVSIYIQLIPADASEDEIRIQRAHQSWHTAMDLLNKEELKRARWKAPYKKTAISKNLSMDEVVMETVQHATEDQPEEVVCKYYREYHAPWAVVQVKYVEYATCAQSSKDFQMFNKKFAWKK